MNTEDYEDMLLARQREALLEIKGIFGRFSDIARALKIERNRVTHWVNGVHCEKRCKRRRVFISYLHAEKLSRLTGVHLGRLVPQDVHHTDTFNLSMVRYMLMPRCIDAARIKIVSSDSMLSDYPLMASALHHPLLVSTRLELISPVARLAQFMRAGFSVVPVMMIDMTALGLYNMRLPTLSRLTLLCDQVTLGLCLESTLISLLDQLAQTALLPESISLDPNRLLVPIKRKSSPSRHSSAMPALPLLGSITEEQHTLELAKQFSERTESCTCKQAHRNLAKSLATPSLRQAFVARCLGLDKISLYEMAKALVEKGDPNLIKQVDEENLPIERAHNLLNVPPLLRACELSELA